MSNGGKTATTQNSLEILDQLLLPETSEYIKILSVEDGWQAIRKMNVRTLKVFYVP
jgi:methylthioribose-1-phosphate isomerase